MKKCIGSQTSKMVYRKRYNIMENNFSSLQWSFTDWFQYLYHSNLNDLLVRSGNASIVMMKIYRRTYNSHSVSSLEKY